MYSMTTMMMSSSFLHLLVVVVVVAVVQPTFTSGQQQSTTTTSTTQSTAPEPYPSIPLEMMKMFTNTSTTAATSTSNNGSSNTYIVINQPLEPIIDPTSKQVTTNKNCFIGDFINGFGYDDNGIENGSFHIPPDPSGAVGTERLIAVVNVMIEVRSKNGTFIFRDGLRDFFTSLGTSQPLTSRFFDPKVVYDEHEGRFVVIALQRDDTTLVSRLLLAVSKNERPDSASEWNMIAINSAIVINNINCWADYPGFEVDEEAVYVTMNMFSFTTPRTNQGVRLWIIAKGVVGGFYGGGTATFSRYDPYQLGGLPSTTMPAQVHGSGGAGSTIGTFLVSFVPFSDGRGSAQVIILRNPLATLTVEYVNIDLGFITQNNFVLPGAPQRGSSALIDAGDLRALDAVWRNNKLWMTFTLNPRAPDVNANQATAHWVRMDTTNGIVTLEAQGNLGGETFASQMRTYYPSVAVNKLGDVVIGYAASSSTSYAGAYGSILLGTTELPFAVQEGFDHYFRDFGLTGRNRWGDYSGVSVDPTDDTFWIFNQFADFRGSVLDRQDGRWGTKWARVSCTLTTPTKAPTNVPIKAPVPILPPGNVPVKAPVPVSPPVNVPVKAPVPVKATLPVMTPVDDPITPPTRRPTTAVEPTETPTRQGCGLFGLSIFCPFTFCGLLGRLLGICNED